MDNALTLFSRKTSDRKRDILLIGNYYLVLLKKQR